jgi:hypothetical protein
LYAINKEVIVEFKVTILTADDLNSSSISDSLIILFMFSFLWGLGIFGILISFIQKHFQKEKIRNFNDQKIKAISRKRSSTTDINVILSKYLDEVFPVVYQTQSYFTRMVQEILKHHRYIELFTITARGHEIDMRKIITCVHLLTVQTMLMFLLAVCYELQFPTDDGSCATHQTSTSCLHESSLFDQNHLCRWVQVSDEEYVCKYRKQEITWQATILISVMVTGFSSLGTLLVDYLFIDILSAPTADSMKATNNTTLTHHDGIPTIRSQLSKQFLSLGRGKGGEVSDSHRRPSSRLTRATSTLKDSLLVDTEVRILPPELIEAYTEAVNSFGQSLGETQEIMKMKSAQRKSQRVTRLTQFKPKQPPQGTADEIRRPEVAAVQKEKEHLTSDELLTSLLMEIKEERGRIKKQSERQAFDSLWGFDFSFPLPLVSDLSPLLHPRINFPDDQQHSSTATASDQSALISLSPEKCDTVKRELQFVIQETEKKVEKLRLASDIHIGLGVTPPSSPHHTLIHRDGNLASLCAGFVRQV